jgi:hypothetical protein
VKNIFVDSEPYVGNIGLGNVENEFLDSGIMVACDTAESLLLRCGALITPII